MSVPINIEINGINKIINPDREIESVVNCMLIDIFCKQISDDELVRSENMLLFFLLKEIQFQCVVIRNEQLATFKEAVKRYNLAYHAAEHVSNPDYQVLFFRVADTVTFNEIIKNNEIEIIEDLGFIKSEDPNIEQHKNSALYHLNEEALVDFYKLFCIYMEDGGTIEECRNYMRAMAAGPLFETLIQSKQIKGIKFSGFTVDTEDQSLIELDPESEMKGGKGTTDYFAKIRAIELEARRSAK